MCGHSAKEQLSRMHSDSIFQASQVSFPATIDLLQILQHFLSSNWSTWLRSLAT
jgi:hypothetical protein